MYSTSVNQMSPSSDDLSLQNPKNSRRKAKFQWNLRGYPHRRKMSEIKYFKMSLNFNMIAMIAIALIALWGPLVKGEQCGVCDPYKCVPPLECMGSLVADGCGCCQVCAKQIKEFCGGLFGRLGKCEPGLQCTISPLPGQNPQEALNGTCTDVTPSPPPESLCDKSKCVETGHVLSCPNDTMLVIETPTVGSCCPPASSCQCKSCDLPHDLMECEVTEVKVMILRATGLPGFCCDVYSCKDKEEVCANVTCPQQEGIEGGGEGGGVCPPDSEPLPPPITHGGCCVESVGCKCKDKSTCEVIACPPGERVQVVLPSLDEPGNCCDKLKCVSNTGLKCTYEGTEYKDAESWSPKHCTTCTCKASLVFCSSMKCDNIHPPNCGWLGLEDEAHCCPVCKGCIGANGSRYGNGETWEHDECTTCRCEEGVSHCQSSLCLIECAHPRKDPSRCCPVCDDKLIVTQAPHCEPPSNCSIQCPGGWKKDETNCYICECNEEVCELICPSGYRHDESGKQLCECEEESFTTHHPTCPPMLKCKKICAHGFKKNKYGCDRCKCRKCPPFDCKKKCIHGYAFSNEGSGPHEGCKICKCKDASSAGAGEVTPALPVSPACMSIDGRLMEDGESWYDGCRRCFCHEGFEWCSLITCPALPCRHPVMRPADCCPSCPEDEPTSLSPGAPARCQSSGGSYRAEGETWLLDACTKCICHMGGVLCQIESCPPVLCYHPIKLPGVCCATCQDGTGDFFQYKPIQLPQSCTSVAGTKFDDGDTWRANACQSCICHNGQIHCFSQTCPLLTCNHTLLKKGQCCPFCVEEHSVSNCHHGGETYVTGEGWLIENCRQCMCDHGHVICSALECPSPRCRFPTKIPGICCPVCTNDTFDSGYQRPAALPPNRTKEPPDDKDVNDVPQEERWYHTFGIAVGVLGAIVVILICLIIILLILLRRTRRKPGVILTASSKVTEVMMPKSTNVELQGLTPISNGHGPLYNGHAPLLNGQNQLLVNDNKVYNSEIPSEKYTSQLIIEDNPDIEVEKEPLNDIKTDDNSPDLLKSNRFSAIEGVLQHELVIPKNPNDFRKSV